MEMIIKLESSMSYKICPVKMKTENRANVFSTMERMVKKGLVNITLDNIH